MRSSTITDSQLDQLRSATMRVSATDRDGTSDWYEATFIGTDLLERMNDQLAHTNVLFPVAR